MLEIEINTSKPRHRTGRIFFLMCGSIKIRVIVKNENYISERINKKIKRYIIGLTQNRLN